MCLSHSGTSEDADKSEDEILAKEVPEIDVIISGHKMCIRDRFYTGQQKAAQARGRVDKFNKKYGFNK